jgi:hypothetical protein
MPTFHGIAWDFGVPEITDVQMDVIVHADPPGRPAASIDGIYIQLYDFRMFTDRPEFRGLGIYSYHGLQSNVFDANQGAWRGKGLLFSRFESSEAEDVKVAAGGWAEFPTPQHIKDEGGRFVGVRNNFAWGKGPYRLQFVPTDENEAGIWYQFKATNMDTGEAISCGSLRFPTIDGRRPLIPNRGSSWIEIYPHTFQLSNFPARHVTFSNVVANDGTIPARSATVNYSDEQAPELNSDISLAGARGAVDFRVGKGVVRATPKGTMLRLN